MSSGLNNFAPLKYFKRYIALQSKQENHVKNEDIRKPSQKLENQLVSNINAKKK